MADTITGSTVAAMRNIYYHSLATLTLSFWDFLMTFGDEVHYIWPMRKKHAFKWLYIFHRHFLLAAHIACQITLPLLPAASSPTARDSRTLLMVMTILIECANFSLKYMLALRVFALFGRRPWVWRFLGCLILVEIVCCIPTTFSSFQSYAGGMLFQLSPDVNIQMALTIVVHSALISLTVTKHISIVGTRGIGRKVISQFTRDGTVTYLMVTGLNGLGFALSTVRDLQAIILVFWALSVFSICGSRLILGMARIQDHMGALREDDNVLLTTHIDVCLSEDLD